MTAKQLDQYALDWIKLRSLTLAKSINKTTLEALRNELALGFEAGESIPQLSKRIEGYFTDNAKIRAKMISRTEVVTASNKGANDRYQKEGVNKIEWLASPDSCSECAPLDGSIFPVNEGPRPSLHPNCRCTILPVLD
jgi:SPP1 gp7 family putative phage head morphogenesis protein